MFGWLKSDDRNRRTAHEIYGAAVAQARHPAFYAEAGIPDTTEGRFEAIVLHLFLAMERLRAKGPVTEDAQRCLIERFVTDMDDQMREMGVGDLSVPKKVKKAAAVFYARAAAYRAGLQQDDDAALNAIAREILPESHHHHAGTLSRYVRAAHAALAAEPIDHILAGRIAFPEPGPFNVAPSASRGMP